MSSHIQHKQPLFSMALDIQNAYGSVNHDRLKLVMKKHGFNEKVSKMFGCMIGNSVIKVLVNGHLTTPFNASVGVPQGDPCSPALFNLYINSVTNICSKFAGINIYNHQLHMLLYADDILVVANTKQDMQKAINALKGELRNKC